MQDKEILKTKEQRKEKIRAKYHDLCADDIEYIPAREQINFFNDDTPKRVAVYVRVSTDSEKQISSFELQKSHYEDFVKNHPHWELIEIYADAYTTNCKSALKKSFEFAIKNVLVCTTHHR